MTVHIGRPAFDVPLHVLLIGTNPEEACRFEEHLRVGDQEATLHWEEDFKTGLQVLGERSPDVLALDLDLPGCEGTEAVRRCVEAAPTIPMVVLTEAEPLGTVRSALQSGAAEYLQKDELSSELVQRTLRWARERKKIDRQRREQEVQLRSITEHVSEGVFRSTPEEGLVYANQAFAEMFGYESVEAILQADPATLCVDPTDQGALIRPVEGRGDADGGEITFRRRDGSTFTGLLRGSVTCGDPCGTVRYDGVITEIPKRSKRERKRKLRVLSQAVEQARESVLITEADPLDEPGPRIAYVNSAFEEMTGYTEEEVLGKTPRILQGPETSRPVLNSLQEALEAEEPWQGETTNYRKDGTPFLTQWNVAPVRDDDGNVEYWVSVQRDVTEEREREETLRRQKYLLEQAQRLTGAWMADVQTGEVSWTDKVYEIFEVPRGEEITTERVLDFYPSEARATLEEAFGRTAEEGEPYDLELPLITETGNGRWVRAVGSPAEKEAGEVVTVAGAVQDITERKERERTLRDREQKAEALYTATEQLVAAQTREAVAEQLQSLVSETFDYLLNGVFFVGEGCLVPAAISSAVPEQIPSVPPLGLEGPSLGARVYHSGETVVAEDLSEVESEVDLGDLGAGACVPLGDHGVLSVASAQTGGIDDFDVRLLELLGAHAATVLDRIEREETLRAERDFLDRILETSPVAIAVFNPEGEFVQASGRAEEMIGLERDEITDRTYNDPAWDVTTPEGEPIPDEELPFARVMATGEPVRDVEHTIKWPNGERRLLSVSGAPLRSPDGELEGAVFHINDITEQREIEQRFRGVFENAGLGIALIDESGAIFEANPALESMLGYEAGELQNVHLEQLTHPEHLDADKQRYQELIAGERDQYQLEKRYLRQDGEAFWGYLTVSRREVTDGFQVVSMVENIDDRKQQEQQLRAAKEEAERMSRLKSAFLANMSHEIRTPLTSILGFAEMIGEQVADDPEGTISQHAHLIEKSGRRLLNTLDRVLNLSRLEAGEMNFSAGALDLAAEVKDTARQFGPQAEEAGVELQMEIGEGPIWCRADKDGLQVVLRNLLSNAIKYTESGGTVWVRTRADDETVVLEVEDTGIGMDPEETDELFEAFVQESEGIGREYEGTGLGLTVAHRIVDEMGGFIEVETRKGGGSCFTVRLPKAEDAT